MKSAARVAAKPESGRASGPARPFFERPVQTKLNVSKPGDRYEREADRAADAVVLKRGPIGRSGVDGTRLSPMTQRMADEEAQMSWERTSDPAYIEHEPVMRSYPPVVEDEPLQMKEDEAAYLSSERTSDPAYTDHEPVMRPSQLVEGDEPLQMMEEEAQTEPEEAHLMEDEDAQPQEEDKSQRKGEEDTQRHYENYDDAQTSSNEAQLMEEEAQRVEEKPVQSKEDEAQSQGDEGVQTRPEAPLASARSVRLQVVERQLKASRGKGNPLPEPVRSKMQTGLNADFSGVRIHVDAPAFLMTKLLKAKAFASGNDIFFSRQRYAPGTREGDHLIAHELTHTLQQGAVDTFDDVRAQRVAEDDRVFSRPESLNAIRIARGQIGQINSKLHGADGNRIGWERLQEIFRGAYGGEVIAPVVIKRIITNPDQLPHWCGVFAWWALKKAGLPLPDWKSGRPMLQSMNMRAPGELPQKGDIAYRDKLPGTTKLTHHQALVSGVEASETAEGKPIKSIKVRTVDGNTAGNDNLGGQVEEKWQPIGNWQAFFNPTSNLSLPDAPLIETDRASEELGPNPDAESPTTTGVGSEQEIDHAADVLESDTDTIPEITAGGLSGLDEVVEVELPPEPDASVEPPALVEKLSLEGSSDEALVSFIDASPSQMAASSPDLGQTLDKKTTSEKKAVAEEAPTLTAKTGGEVDPGITSPDDLPVPADMTLDAQGKGLEVGELSPDPYEEKGTAPSAKATRDEMKKQPEGGLLDWFRNQFSNILNSIKTADNTVNTTAGPKKRVALTGDADVGQMGRQREDRTQQLRGQRDDQVATFKTHPGQSNIQPRKISEARTPAVTQETAEPIEALPPDNGVADFAAAELPKNVRDATDAKMAPGLKSNLNEARMKTAAAASTRDAEKDAAITEAERKTAKANQDANDGQRKAVLAGRTDVARQQGEAIGGAYDGVAEFSKDTGKRQIDDQKKIGDDVKKEESRADTALEDGEKEAKRVKKEQEAKAAEKKAELKKKKEKQGLLDRAVGFVKDVVSKITEAIDAIFDTLRSLVKTAIEAAKKVAIGFINAARKAAISKLNNFRDWAKDKVGTYVKDRFPGLAKALNKGIDATVNVAIDGVNAAADAAIEVVEALADALGKALDRVLAAFQAGLKAAVQIAGAVLTGDFAGALRIAIEAACEIAGIDPQPIFNFMDRAGKQITAILKSPGKFINNVMTAIGIGVRGFAERFGQHFKTGVISWLTGALSAVPITLPQKWDVKGFFSLVAQILGLTYDNIKARVIKKFPKAAKVFDQVEKGFAFMKMLINKDYSGLWEEVKAKLADLKQSIIGSIKNWAIINVIKEGVVWLLSLLNPASALVKALKLLADLVFWLIDNFQQIKSFVLSVYEAITNIAAGIVAPAAKAVEGALARSLPVVISFVASAIGLSGIGEAVQGVIQKLTAPINKMIDVLIDKVVVFARKLWGKTKEGAKSAKEKVKRGAKAAAGKIKDFFWPKKTFMADGETHKLYFKKSGGKQEMFVASTPRKVEMFLDDVQNAYGASFTKHEKQHCQAARLLLKHEIKPLEARINARLSAKKNVSAKLRQQMIKHQDGLAKHLRLLIGAKSMFANAVEKYKLEGFVTTFAQMPTATGDLMTPDHQPQAAALKHLARNVKAFNPPDGANMRKRGGTSPSDHAKGGWTINLHHFRHMLGRTYSTKGKGTSKVFKSKIAAIPAGKTPLQQREIAVGNLKAELDKDVTVMNAIYDRPYTDAVWNDLTPLTANPQQKQKLVTKIRKQVRRGESQIRSQPMAELTK